MNGKDKEYEPDFYLSESLEKPYGLHEAEFFKGEFMGRRRRR